MTNLEIEMAILKNELKNIKDTLVEHIRDQKIDYSALMKKLDEFIICADAKYADAEQFRFWRNLLILGIFVSTLVGVIGIWIDKILR